MPFHTVNVLWTHCLRWMVVVPHGVTPSLYSTFDYGRGGLLSEFHPSPDSILTNGVVLGIGYRKAVFMNPTSLAVELNLLWSHSVVLCAHAHRSLWRLEGDTRVFFVFSQCNATFLYKTIIH